MLDTPAAGDPPVCQGPDPHPRAARRLKVPNGAVDTHAHVIGAPPAYPWVARRSYTPPPAMPAAYIGMLDATGMRYGVLVQVSVHGSDNRLMLETIAAHRDRLRGVCVVAPDVGERELDALAAGGIVGCRINGLFRGGVGVGALEPLAHRIKRLGWHIQLLLDAGQLPVMMPALARLPVPFVIDHMGHIPTTAGV